MRELAKKPQSRLRKKVVANSGMYILLLPAIVLMILFFYLPLGGAVIAFKEFDPFLGILESPWADHFGFGNFVDIFKSKEIIGAIGNTLLLSSLSMVLNFFCPILLALIFNEYKPSLFKRGMQTLSYLPYFLSWIAVIGIFKAFLAPDGPINGVIESFGGEPVSFLTKQALFVPNLLFITLWKCVGWDSIIYLAALSAIDSTLYEAAQIDGAGRWKQILNITIPSILPTAIILLIMKVGGIFGTNFELIYGMQNVYINFETIDTMVYKTGLVNGQFSMAAAMEMAKGLIGFLLVAITNKISKTVSETSLW